MTLNGHDHIRVEKKYAILKSRADLHSGRACTVDIATPTERPIFKQMTYVIDRYIYIYISQLEKG